MNSKVFNEYSSHYAKTSIRIDPSEVSSSFFLCLLSLHNKLILVLLTAFSLKKPLAIISFRKFHTWMVLIKAT